SAGRSLEARASRPPRRGWRPGPVRLGGLPVGWAGRRAGGARWRPAGGTPALPDSPTPAAAERMSPSRPATHRHPEPRSWHDEAASWERAPPPPGSAAGSAAGALSRAALPGQLPCGFVELARLAALAAPAPYARASVRRPNVPDKMTTLISPTASRR